MCLCECRKVKKGTICQSYNLGKIIHLNVEINSGSTSPNIGSSFGHPPSQTSISRRYYSHNYEKNWFNHTASPFSILSETLPVMQGDPFASDSEDETYVCPEKDVDSSDSHLTSSDDDGDSDDPE